MIKKLSVLSVFECLDYVIDYSGEETFCIISIQNTRNNGFGFRFIESDKCLGVLTLLFDDIEQSVEGYQHFTEEQASTLISFFYDHAHVDRLLIHCYAGQSRSVAVGAALTHLIGKDNQHYFKTREPNRFVYECILLTWKKLEDEYRAKLNNWINKIEHWLIERLEVYSGNNIKANQWNLYNIYLTTDAKSPINTVCGLMIDIMNDEQLNNQEKYRIIDARLPLIKKILNVKE